MKRLKKLLPTDPEKNWQRQEALWALSKDAVQRLLAKCEKLGIPFDFIAVSPLFDGMRAAYEYDLQHAHPTPGQRRKARKERSLLRSASTLIAFLKEQQAFFGSLGEDLERQMAAYRRQHIDPWFTTRLPRHRPTDPWLTEWILGIAADMRKHGTSLRTILREIPHVMMLAGHGDLVTTDKVRHIIRQARRNDPDFAALFVAPGAKLPTPAPTSPTSATQRS